MSARHESREARVSREMGSIPTPFNRSKRTVRMVRVDGHWQPIDAESIALRRVLFGSVQSSSDLRHDLPALAAARVALGLNVMFNPLLAM